MEKLWNIGEGMILIANIIVYTVLLYKSYNFNYFEIFDSLLALIMIFVSTIFFISKLLYSQEI